MSAPKASIEPTTAPFTTVQLFNGSLEICRAPFSEFQGDSSWLLQRSSSSIHGWRVRVGGPTYTQSDHSIRRWKAKLINPVSRFRGS
jgi:hypothetical protein